MTALLQPRRDAWYPVALAHELAGRPVRRMLLGQPLVVFRVRDEIAVLSDHCPHRGAALSGGQLRHGGIECPYHGWRFAPDGRCVAVPGAQTPATARAEAWPSLVRDGVVWASLAPAETAPPLLPEPVDDGRYDRFWWALDPSRAVWIEAIENLLDAAHPHFVHAGLVRSGKLRHPVKVTVRQEETWVEAAYEEGRRAAALVPRLIEGLRTRSLGRFFPPATAQIAFEGPQGPRLAITVVFTPETADRVRPFAHFATPRGRLPAALKRVALKLANGPILAQDRAVLARQADNIAAFPDAAPAIGPLDFLRPSIHRLASGERLTPGERSYDVEL